MPLTRREIAPVLEHAFGHRLTVKEIQESVARFYGIKSDYMRGPDGANSGNRERRVCRPRQVAMFFARTMTPMSLPEIGRRFGGRDHSTVIHAVRTVERLSAEDPILEAEIEVLREGFGG